MKNSRKDSDIFQSHKYLRGSSSLSETMIEASKLPNFDLASSKSAESAGSSIQSIVRRSMFWPPSHLGENWNEYVPFAFWIVDALKPKRLVEVGDVSPVSYFSFCQAVKGLSLDAQCFAINTYESDGKSRRERAFVDKFSSQNDQLYGAFSSIVECELASAPALFLNDEIDLLHLNFSSESQYQLNEKIGDWLNVLSHRGVILLTGIGIQSKKPKLRSLLSELKHSYSVFELNHGEGLALIGVGKELDPPIKELLRAEQFKDVQAIKEIFSRLGQSCFDAYKLGTLNKVVPSRLDSTATEALIEENIKEQQRLQSNLTKANRETSDAKKQADQLRLVLEKRDNQLRGLYKEKSALEKKIQELRSDDFRNASANKKSLEEAHGTLRVDLESARKQAEVMEAELLQSRKLVSEQSLKLETVSADLNSLLSLRERQTTEIATLTTLLLHAEDRLEKTQSEMTSMLAAKKKAEQLTEEERKQGGFPSLLRVFGTNSKKGKGSGSSVKLLQAKKLLLDSALFDEKWYLSKYPEVAGSNMPPVEHYLTIGASLGYDPSANFDSSYYLEKYGDVAMSGMNPLVHYLRFGIGENRNPKAK